MNHSIDIIRFICYYYFSIVLFLFRIAFIALSLFISIFVFVLELFIQVPMNSLSAAKTRRINLSNKNIRINIFAILLSNGIVCLWKFRSEYSVLMVNICMPIKRCFHGLSSKNSYMQISFDMRLTWWLMILIQYWINNTIYHIIRWIVFYTFHLNKY